MLALQGSPGDPSGADAYGVIASPPYDGKHLIIHIGNTGTFGLFGRVADAPWTVSEVSFDESDIFGTYQVPGHPGVIGLWLNSYARGGTVDSDTLEAPDPPPKLLAAIDTSLYTVPDFTPAAAGYMFRRGVTWAPGQGERAYP